jgi:allantoicase
MSEEEDENIIHNEKQKKQLLVFSKKIEEIISEYQNRKKFGIPKIKEDNLQKVDLKQYNEFYEKMEEQKNMANAYKQKLNNDEKFDEITKKEDELKNLKQEFQEIEKEYQYLLKSNRRMDGFQNNLLDDEIKYYKTELQNIKDDITLKNKEHIKYNENIKETRKEINSLEKIYDLIQKNIEFKKELNKNPIYFTEEITNEIVETEKENLTNQVESAANVYKKLLKEKDNLENNVIKLKEELSNYKYDAHINELKMKEIEKIENEVKANKVNEQNKIKNLKKIEENERKKKTKKMKNLLVDSFKNNFPFKNNNYKLLLEEEKKQKYHLNGKPKFIITKNRMKNSKSSIDVFSTRREEIKKKREKEKEEFMSNLDKELKEHEEQKGKVFQEIKSLKDDIEKSLESNKISDDYLVNLKKDKEK